MLHGILSYWMLPLFSATVWIAMLLALLIHWLQQGQPHYESMEPGQKIAYISDVGAEDFKPLFIAMGAVSVITFDLAFVAERWLRHNHRLVHNTTRTQKTLAAFSIIFSLIGAAGLILLAIFDVKRHKLAHDFFIAFFIGGYVISAIFTCAEYQRLGKYFREFRILRLSFWMKLFFIIIEIGLAITFGALNKFKMWNAGAIVEWTISFVYSIYVLSFVVDFVPAARGKHGAVSGQTAEEMGMARNTGEVGNGHFPAAGGYAADGYGRDSAAYSGRTSGGWLGRKEQSPRGIV